VGDAALAVDLLLTENLSEAGQLAAVLSRDNQERQKIESLVMAEAMGVLDADPAMSEGRVIVLASPGWHPGVVGIVASRLMEKYSRPVLMIALDGGEGKGSGRSIPGFNLYHALSHCRELLLRFGGHAHAAGFSILEEKVDMLRSSLNEYAERFVGREIYRPGIDLDAAVSLNDVTGELVEELHMLAPFGHCNPGPVLACREAVLLSCREIGKNGEHLKMVLKEKNAVLDGIAFGFAASANEIAAASEVEVAFSPSINHWGGRKSVQLKVIDIRPAGAGWEIEESYAPGSSLAGKNGTGLHGAADSLKKMGPLALLPEFVSEILNRYREVSPNFMFPGRYLDFFSKEAPVSESQTAVQERMIDKRHSLYKPALLYKLAARKGGTLVLVNSPGRAVELSVFLNCSGIRASFMHSGVLAGDAGGVEEGFNAGRISAVVCTYRTCRALNLKPRRTVFFEVPFSREEYGQAWAGGAENHILFEKRDIRTCMEFLESAAPGRDRLADLYLYMRKAGGAGHINPEQAAGYLQDCGLARAGLHTVAFGLAVFSDLGLAECRQDDNRYLVTLNPVGEKKDLSSSAAYRTGQEARSGAEKWLKGFYQWPVTTGS
jgi:single-stranded-DNA-specific exonuclease